MSMLLAIQPTFDFVSIPHNLTTLNGFIYGSDLGLAGTSQLINPPRVRARLQLRHPQLTNRPTAQIFIVNRGCTLGASLLSVLMHLILRLPALF